MQEHHKKLIKRNTISDFYAGRNGSTPSLNDGRYNKIYVNIYIHGVFTKNPYSKPLARNVVNIEPHNVTDVRINHGSLQSDWTSALFRS